MLHPFLPYVTEEIYGMLPIKDSESIMIDKYPVYNKKHIYKDEEVILDEMLEFVTLFRNKRTELNVGSDYSVDIKIDNKDVRELVINLLKLQDKENSNIDGNVEKVKIGNIEINIIYDNSKNAEAEKELLLKEKSNLESSIARREKLLGNENYVNKAPSNVVEAERLALSKEKERLEIINSKI